MTTDEFLSWATTRGVKLLPKIQMGEIASANLTIQHQRIAMMPISLMNFYQNIAGGAYLGNAYIFGIADSKESGQTTYEIPGIISVNRELSGLQAVTGRTIFGRNDLFWFGFDAFGKFYMLNNINLKPVRQYDDLYRAMTDCLAIGKI
ncbi:MAG: hypothetical protein LBL75_01935 [Rickettsiales bacterium]|jgi:hypothetical protein|nr:hypothetical protein [Rickettsiales bacterium]